MLALPDVRAWVETGPSNSLVDKVDLFSRHIVKGLHRDQQVTTAQIRQVFAKMKAIEAKGGIVAPNQQVDFLMLKPQLAYAAGRHGKQGLDALKERLTEGINVVLEPTTSQEQQYRFKNFCLLFEAILSYHKAHHGI